MEKVIAILTQKGSLSKGINTNTTINLFKLRDDQVTEVENIELEEVSHKSFSLLMALKEVSIIYIDSISKELKQILDTISITTKMKDDLDNDHFINKFIFD